MDDSLSFESFLEGAKKAAHRAMDDHGRGEYDEFALHAGVAIERLAKAVLVSKNPIYIVEVKGNSNSNTDMLFHMGGHRRAKKVRTIGASEAISRLRALDVLSPDKELDTLIDVRNGVAHAGSGDEAKAFLPTLAKTVETLLKDLGGSLNAFWGRWTIAARMAVDNKRSKVYRDVQVRIKQAKHRYDDRFSDLPEHLQQHLKIEQLRLDVFRVGLTGSGIQIESREKCPACGSGAHVLSANQGTEESPHFTVIALRCSMCYLRLATRDELEAAGVDVKSVDDRAAYQAATFFDGAVLSERTFHMRVEQFLNTETHDPD
ncbi:hypothetical protein ABZS71_06550 [Streptomyces sp. NPDC005393]|uniref:hypothetical protein n=1 Tax=Streptomyces sp. NPDC005393 TaxID=3157041 RepID=UPI0033B7AD24